MIETRRILAIICMAAISQLLMAKTFYVATDGDDAQAGDQVDLPLATISKAIDLADPGDTIFVRGGVYMPESRISITKSGEPDQIFRLWAYPGEVPVLNFSNLPAGSNDRGIKLNARYWHIRGFIISHAPDNGMIIDSGHFNIIERCTFHNNGDTGLQISGGSAYNEVINCDSYFNADETYENADGFAAKLNIGSRNRFIGCRAWNNSDDGWDLYEGQKPVEISFCMAFQNGYLEDGSPALPNGDMNGFKLGGNNVAANHIVSNCLAFKNGSKGFDQNNNSGVITLLNNTAWSNGTYYAKPNFSFPNRQHIFKNNISYLPADDDRLSSGESSNNSWEGFSVSEDDFLSLDVTEGTSPRQADGNLPDMNLLKLSQGSDMIDGGLDVGYPYIGSAPDLGAWDTDQTAVKTKYITLVSVRTVYGITEPASNLFPKGETLEIEAIPFDGYLFKEWQGSVASTENPLLITPENNIFLQAVYMEDTSSTGKPLHSAQTRRMHLFPNPAKDRITILPEGLETGTATIAVMDMAGRTLHYTHKTEGKSENQLDADLSAVPPGLYLLIVRQGNNTWHQKFVRE